MLRSSAPKGPVEIGPGSGMIRRCRPEMEPRPARNRPRSPDLPGHRAAASRCWKGPACSGATFPRWPNRRNSGAEENAQPRGTDCWTRDCSGAARWFPRRCNSECGQRFPEHLSALAPAPAPDCAPHRGKPPQVRTGSTRVQSWLHRYPFGLKAAIEDRALSWKVQFTGTRLARRRNRRPGYGPCRQTACPNT